MQRVVKVDGKEVRLRASAAVPRMYRVRFGRDIIQDMQTIQREISAAEAERRAALEAGNPDPGSTLPVTALTLFENVAYTMHLHGDPEAVPDTVEEWLEGFGTFSIYDVFPVIMELWSENLRTLNLPKKKYRRRKGK